MEEDTEEQEWRSSIVYTPFDEEAGPAALPPFLLNGAAATPEAVLRHVVTLNRLGQRFAAFLQSPHASAVLCDAFWWVYLRYFVLMRPATELPAVPRPKPSLPLHVSEFKKGNKARSIVLLDRVSAPGTHQEGLAFDALSTISPRSDAGSRGSQPGTPVPDSTRSCRSYASFTSETSAVQLARLPQDEREVFVESEEKDIFGRICAHYVPILRSFTTEGSEHRLFPFILAQAVCFVLDQSIGNGAGSLHANEIQGLFSFWLSGVQRSKVRAPNPAGKKHAFHRKHHAAKKEQAETAHSTETEVETALSTLKKELQEIQDQAKLSFQRKVRGYQRLRSPDIREHHEHTVKDYKDERGGFLHGTTKKLRPLPKRVREMLKKEQEKERATAPWFEYGSKQHTLKRKRVATGSFCTTDCSPVLQHLLLQKVCLRQSGRTADMLWSIN